MNEEKQHDENTQERIAEALPYTGPELATALYRPYRVIEYVLAQKFRWIATVLDQRQIGLLVLVMLLASLLYAFPYGMVLGLKRFWHISAMFLGSALICFPSLHVFNAFLSIRNNLGQTLALILLTSSVAAIFTFGFFPILWFFKVTMMEGDSTSVLTSLSEFLLITSVVAGVMHLCRCLYHERRLYSSNIVGFWIVLLFWQGLLIFITYRMGMFLGLL